ncbi:DUF302 domain-containing protein [Thioalkalivibrio paradoxus]|nr:DUF302 domain-containing protein [Thioalkalivibrio paradoxus]
MSRMKHLKTLLLVPMLLLVWGAQAVASEVQTRGGAFYVYLSPAVEFSEVLERLYTEIEAQSWEVLRVQDIDDGLREHYGIDIENKVIYACRSKYLAEAIKENPNVTLLVPCRIAIYRVDYAGRAAGPGAEGGKIVIGVTNPIHEADLLGIEERETIKVVADELRSMLEGVAEFYH